MGRRLIQNNRGFTPPFLKRWKSLGRAGFTLTELLIASVIASFVFLTASSGYLAGFKFHENRSMKHDLLPLLAVNEMSQTISLGNDSVLDPTRATLRTFVAVRLDYKVNPTTGALTPNGSDGLGTPSIADDSWVIYKVLREPGKDPGTNTWRLRWKVGTSALDPVSNSDQEVVPELELTSISGFQHINPTGAGEPVLVKMVLHTPDNALRATTATVSVGSKAK